MDTSVNNEIHVGIDTGGTFTDCILSQQGIDPIVLKVHSTPDNPAKAIIEGLVKLCEVANIKVKEVTSLSHGTTVATNAMLQEQWAKVGLLTTEGFRDVLEIGTQMRPELYQLHQKKLTPLIPRNLRKEVDERTSPTGEIINELNDEQVRETLKELMEHDVDSLAVSLLFSYANSDHEKRIKEIVQEVAPELYVGISSEVSPEFREYTRTTTTVINAALMPVVKNYIQYLRKQLQERDAQLNFNVMQSNGGIVSGKTEIPAHKLILSGPAGGIVAAADISQKMGFDNVLTFDMGGTSSDVGIIVDAQPQIVEGTTVNGVYPLQTPTVDIHTIGAGGGSIGWKDTGGALKVGPKSAGAHPGPACYGKGGEEPTVTDANLFLGRLAPEHFLGGNLKVYPEKSKEALQKLANELDLDIERVALGILSVADANMVGALRVVSSQRGHDPRDFALIAFGGAGPLHATSLARELGIKNIIIPATPGVLCAHGLLLSDIRHDLTHTDIVMINEANPSDIEKNLVHLEKRGTDRLQEDGIEVDDAILNRSLDLRYKGQEYYLNVPISGPLTSDTLQKAETDFHRIHKSTYGHAAETEPVEIVNLRLSAIGEIERNMDSELDNTPSSQKKTEQSRQVYFENHKWVTTPVYQRNHLELGKEIVGPAIINQMDSTVVVEPNQTFKTDQQGNLIIRLEEDK